MNSKRNVYLNMKSIEQAKKLVFSYFENYVTKIETLDTINAKARVLASPVFAAISAPNFHAAAMDGIAVDAKDTFNASEHAPTTLVIDENAFWVNTGNVMPDGVNAVIMIEHLNIIDEKRLEIEAPVFPWQNVRKMGEDIVATKLLFPRGHNISSYCLGALLSGGVFQVDVYKQPKVLIIPTGSELKQWHTIMPSQLKPGNVIESNSLVLSSLCKDHGAQVECHPMLKEKAGYIKEQIKLCKALGFSWH